MTPSRRPCRPQPQQQPPTFKNDPISMIENENGKKKNDHVMTTRFRSNHHGGGGQCGGGHHGDPSRTSSSSSDQLSLPSPSPSTRSPSTTTRSTLQPHPSHLVDPQQALNTHETHKLLVNHNKKDPKTNNNTLSILYQSLKSFMNRYVIVPTLCLNQFIVNNIYHPMSSSSSMNGDMNGDMNGGDQKNVVSGVVKYIQSLNRIIQLMKLIYENYYHTSCYLGESHGEILLDSHFIESIVLLNFIFGNVKYLQILYFNGKRNAQIENQMELLNVLLNTLIVEPMNTTPHVDMKPSSFDDSDPIYRNMNNTIYRNNTTTTSVNDPIIHQSSETNPLTTLYHQLLQIVIEMNWKEIYQEQYLTLFFAFKQTNLQQSLKQEFDENILSHFLETTSQHLSQLRQQFKSECSSNYLKKKHHRNYHQTRSCCITTAEHSQQSTNVLLQSFQQEYNTLMKVCQLIEHAQQIAYLIDLLLNLTCLIIKTSNHEYRQVSDNLQDKCNELLAIGAKIRLYCESNIRNSSRNSNSSQSNIRNSNTSQSNIRNSNSSQSTSSQSNIRNSNSSNNQINDKNMYNHNNTQLYQLQFRWNKLMKLNNKNHDSSILGVTTSSSPPQASMMSDLNTTTSSSSELLHSTLPKYQSFHLLEQLEQELNQLEDFLTNSIARQELCCVEYLKSNRYAPLTKMDPKNGNILWNSQVINSGVNIHPTTTTTYFHWNSSGGGGGDGGDSLDELFAVIPSYLVLNARQIL
nr:unnamed protein product [Naegleria fowleri]